MIETKQFHGSSSTSDYIKIKRTAKQAIESFFISVPDNLVKIQTDNSIETKKIIITK